jgi:anti-anti-sigma factor
MDGESLGSAPFTVSVQHLDGHADVVATGELDLATAPALQRTFDQLVQDGHRDLRLNCSALRFLDATGIAVLMQIQRDARELGGGLVLTDVSGSPRRVLDICGLLGVLTDGAHEAGLAE